MRPMKVFVGYLILWVICAILLLISSVGESENFILLAISIGVMLLGNIAFIFLYRCPHCDRLLFNRVAPWHHCPYCGNHLNENIDSEYDFSTEEEDDESKKRSDGIKIQ